MIRSRKFVCYIALAGLVIAIIAWAYALPVTCACPPELQSPDVTAGDSLLDNTTPIPTPQVPGNDIPATITNYDDHGHMIASPESTISFPRADITPEAYESFQMHQTEGM